MKKKLIAFILGLFRDGEMTLSAKEESDKIKLFLHYKDEKIEVTNYDVT